MVSSCSAPAAAGSRQGEVGLLRSAWSAVSLETQHQEQLKPDLEDKQPGVSVGRSPCFKARAHSVSSASCFWHRKEVWGFLPFAGVRTLV